MADEDVNGTDEQQTEDAAVVAADGGEAVADAPVVEEAVVEDWRAGLEGDLAKRAQKFASPVDMAKSYFELESRLGRSVVKPGKNATPDEIKAYHKQLGVPDEPSGYTLPMSEAEAADEAVVARLNAFRAKMHEAGAPPAAVAAAYQTYQEMVKGAAEDQQAAIDARRDEFEQALRQEWRGKEFDTNVNYAKRAVAAFDGDKQFTKWLETAQVDGVPAGDHPQFLKLFAKVGRTMAEDTVHLAPTEDEVQSAKEQAQNIREAKREALARGDSATAQRLDEQERQLYARQNRQPIVGRGGRAA